MLITSAANRLTATPPLASMMPTCRNASTARLDQVATEMVARGLRVLAVAGGRLAEALRPNDPPPQPGPLTLLGFRGMIDPLRAGAREAVAECHRAGVLVSMVTGDHRVAATGDGVNDVPVVPRHL